jgi:glutamate:GABA antiporter
VARGSPSQLASGWLPHFSELSNWAFLTQIVISLIGIELSAVHAGDIKEPAKTIPKAFLTSGILILVIVVGAPLAIGSVIPADKINIISGLLDALKIFFQNFQVPIFVFLGLLALTLIGNIGTVTGWMISSTRGMFVASVDCGMPSLFQMTNRYHAPLGVLILEAIIVTGLFGLFALSTIQNIYWILLVLASQINLIYYILIFASGVKLKKSYAKSFQIPGGKKGTAVAAALASLSCLLAIFFGFFPPSTGEVQEGKLYPLFLAVGILLSLAFPLVLLKMSNKNPASLSKAIV